MSKTKDAVIENVADVIREVLNTFKGGRRWTKNSYGPINRTDTEATYCLVGGVRAVLGGGNQNVGKEHPLYMDTIKVLGKVIYPRNAKRHNTGAIISFNDSTRTTFDRVEAILAAALVKARQFAGVA